MFHYQQLDQPQVIWSENLTNINCVNQRETRKKHVGPGALVTEVQDEVLEERLSVPQSEARLGQVYAGVSVMERGIYHEVIRSDGIFAKLPHTN